MTFHAAIWTAVSTTAQVEDKDSLPNQEKVCSAAIAAKQWQNTGLLYSVPGQSRTRYVDLRVAEAEIPQLHAMLDDARQGKFNLLVMYDFNRLRDLLQPIAKMLESFGAQLYSVNQPVDPLPPENFSRYASDSSAIMRGISGILSDAQIADLQRKYRHGNKARVERGLHSLGVPWGYRVINKKFPAEQVPEQVAVILKIHELFWEGKNYTEIADQLNQDGIPSPRGSVWRFGGVRAILGEEYYAGKVYFGRLRVRRNFDRNQLETRANPAVEFFPGKHKPLWTWHEHLRIIAEMERRAKAPNRHYTYSGLLWCSVCKGLLFRSASYNGYVCKKYCTGMRHYEIHALVGGALQKALATLPVDDLPTDGVVAVQVRELQEQRARVQRLYQAGSPIYTQEEAEREILALDARIKAYNESERTQEKSRVHHEQQRRLLTYWQENLTALPHVLADPETDPRTMNQILRQLVKRITVTPDARLTVEVR